MITQIAQMDADFKRVEFDQFGCRCLITSNSRGLECFNRVDFDTVGNYGDFATIREVVAYG